MKRLVLGTALAVASMAPHQEAEAYFPLDCSDDPGTCLPGIPEDPDDRKSPRMQEWVIENRNEYELPEPEIKKIGEAKKTTTIVLTQDGGVRQVDGIKWEPVE